MKEKADQKNEHTFIEYGSWEDLLKSMPKADTMWQKIKRLYWKIIPYNWRPGQIWYRLTCFCWHRYTTIHPKTLPWHTWMDRDVLLEHCMFEILCRFIEDEKPAEYFEIENSNYKEEWKQLFALYNWWKTVYVPEWKNGDSEKLEDTLKEKMHQLVDLRELMWT